MPLAPGSSLGVYQIIAAIGAGGMGEVYRARDTKLKRDVAIKVLPDLVVHDPHRLARFEREAQLLASLNHPNIAAIYGLEDSTIPALVLELVEGPTLAELSTPMDSAACGRSASTPRDISRESRTRRVIFTARTRAASGRALATPSPRTASCSTGRGASGMSGCWLGLRRARKVRLKAGRSALRGNRLRNERLIPNP